MNRKVTGTQLNLHVLPLKHAYGLSQGIAKNSLSLARRMLLHRPQAAYSLCLFSLLPVPPYFASRVTPVRAFSPNANFSTKFIARTTNSRPSSLPYALDKHTSARGTPGDNMENRAEKEEQPEEECPIDAPPGFCSKYDDLGCPVFETDAASSNSAPPSSSSLSSAPCIRLQATPDPCLIGMTTAADVENKIRQVREEMEQYCNADLYTRRWIPSPAMEAYGSATNDDEINSTGTRASHSFSVVQFNALAEGLSSGASYPLPFGRSKEHKRDDKAVFGGFTAVPSPEVCLNYHNRRWRILETVIGGSCYREARGVAEQADNSESHRTCPFDIIAMEEVDRFDGLFAPALALFGYQGVFNAKPHAPGVSLGFYSDGVALFFKTETFDLLDKARKSFGTGTQVYLLATLRHKASGNIVLVAVTHLKASKSKENAKIREHQSAELLDVLHKKAASIAENEGGHDKGCDVPILVLGDFNAEPDEAAVQTFVSRKDESTPPFASAYPLDMPYSTWKTRGSNAVRRVIDYIFYKTFSRHERSDGMDKEGADKGRIECTEILGLPADKDMESHGLPGFRSPSDHLALAAKFCITCRR